MRCTATGYAVVVEFSGGDAAVAAADFVKLLHLLVFKYGHYHIIIITHFRYVCLVKSMVFYCFVERVYVILLRDGLGLSRQVIWAHCHGIKVFGKYIQHGVHAETLTGEYVKVYITRIIAEMSHDIAGFD